jgi:predicted transcriptional regulator
MARESWLDADDHPTIDAHMQQLEHFTKAIEDGVIDKAELAQQEKNLIAAMQAAEDVLSDEAHAAVTKLLAELAAYTVMETLHSMTSARLQQAIK